MQLFFLAIRLNLAIFYSVYLPFFNLFLEIGNYPFSCMCHRWISCKDCPVFVSREFLTLFSFLIGCHLPSVSCVYVCTILNNGISWSVVNLLSDLKSIIVLLFYYLSSVENFIALFDTLWVEENIFCWYYCLLQTYYLNHSL